MTLTDLAVTSALARAAERWQRAFSAAGSADVPQLSKLSLRRESDTRAPSALPSPFRMHRGT